MTIPIVQNSYEVKPILNLADVFNFLRRGRFSRADLGKFLRNEDALLTLLRHEGFYPDEDERLEGITALTNVDAGVDVGFQSGKGRATNVTINARPSQYAIDPQYLDALVEAIRRGGFRVTEERGAKREYPYRQYDWGSPRGRAMLAGHKY